MGFARCNLANGDINNLLVLVLSSVTVAALSAHNTPVLSSLVLHTNYTPPWSKVTFKVRENQADRNEKMKPWTG